ncbi:hypothetical protein Tco_1141719 [Tanacetum coccineum]
MPPKTVRKSVGGGRRGGRGKGPPKTTSDPVAPPVTEEKEVVEVKDEEVVPVKVEEPVVEQKVENKDDDIHLPNSSKKM